MSTQGVGKVSNTKGNNTQATSRPTQIKVKQGETVTKLAKKYGMSVEEFKQWVGLKSNTIKIGQVINLPSAEVPKGKGILALAREYDMTLEEFGKLNNLPKPYKDYVAASGEKFYVKKKSAPTPTPAKKDSAKQTTPTPAPAKSDSSKATAPKPKTTPAPAPNNSQANQASENKKKWGSSYTPQELGENIYSKACEYNGAVGKPDFDALIKEINPKNASEVLNNYKKNPKNKSESLLSTITSEVRSSKDARKKAVMHIYDQVAKAKNTPASVRKTFEKELNEQFDSFGMVNTDKLDRTLNRMMASPKELATLMKEEIHNKWGAVGKESFNELVELVSPQNAEQVIKEYANLKTGESLIEGITSEVKSSKDARKKAVMHIYDQLAKAKNYPADKRAAFEKELNDQFDSFGMVKTDKLDSMINEMLNAKTPEPAKTTPATPKPASGGKTVRLTNGKTFSSEELRQGAIASAKKDKGFKKVKNPYIDRPLPNLDANGKIEASATIKQPTNPNGPMKGKVVIINPGHGGYRFDNGYFDSGTVLSVKNREGNEMPIEEWKVAGTYADDLTAKLQARGATVVIVSGSVGDKRTAKGGMSEDKYLERLLQGQKGSEEIRKLMKNTPKSNMAFISLHVESTEVPSTQKLCTVRGNRCKADHDLAERVQGHVAKNISILKPELATNDYYVTRAMGSEIPSVLVEIGNIQNSSITNSLLSSTDRGKYTQALADALEETLVK